MENRSKNEKQIAAEKAKIKTGQLAILDFAKSILPDRPDLRGDALFSAALWVTVVEFGGIAGTTQFLRETADNMDAAMAETQGRPMQ